MSQQQPWPGQRQPEWEGVPAPTVAPAEGAGAPPPWTTGPVPPAGQYGVIPQQRGPEAWSGPPAWGPGYPSGPVPPPPPPRRGNTGLIVAVVVLVVVLLAGGVAFFLWQRSSTQTAAPAGATAGGAAPSAAASGGSVPGGATAQAPATKALPSPPSASQVPAPGQGPGEQTALATLSAMRAASLARVPLDGRWVAQVASKYVGVTDPLQTAANGTHTFYATDILSESLGALSTVDNPSKVYLLWGTDFGQRTTGPNGAPLWTTIVDAGYASHDNVLAWCHVTFPSLTPDQLADTCAPRQLTSPHD